MTRHFTRPSHQSTPSSCLREPWIWQGRRSHWWSSSWWSKECRCTFQGWDGSKAWITAFFSNIHFVFFITFVYFINLQKYIENLKILFLKYYCMSSAENSDPIVCPRDLEGLLHRPHWITRGHRGAQMDCLHIPQGRHHVRTCLLLCMQRCGQMNMIATEPGLFLCRLRALEIQFLCLSRFHKFCSN